MEFAVSDKVATFGKKPHIKKGYYSGKLIEIKPREKEGQYGKQIILIFAVYDSEGKNPVVVKEGNKETDLFLPVVLNSEYKQEDGSFRSAFTPNSRITKVFQCLGWLFDASKSINTDDFIGKFVELNIDDMEVAWTNEKNESETYKASAIKDVNKFEVEEGATPPSPSTKSEEAYEKTKPVKIEKTLNHTDVKERIAKLKNMFEEGIITKNGCDMAIESLRKVEQNGSE